MTLTTPIPADAARESADAQRAYEAGGRTPALHAAMVAAQRRHSAAQRSSDESAQTAARREQDEQDRRASRGRDRRCMVTGYQLAYHPDYVVRLCDECRDADDHRQGALGPVSCAEGPGLCEGRCH